MKDLIPKERKVRILFYLWIVGLLLLGCTQKAATIPSTFAPDAAGLESGGVQGEIIELRVAVPYSKGYERPHGIHIKLSGLAKISVSKDAEVCVLMRTAQYYATPADLLMYKVLFIPLYALQGMGKAIARGESQYLNNVIFVDLIRRMVGKDGRWEDDARDHLYVDPRVPSVRVGYWRNLYNWTDWFSPFLGTGRTGFDVRESHFWSSTVREWRQQSGKILFVDGRIPPEFIRQVEIFAPSAINTTGRVSATYVPPADIEENLSRFISGSIYKVDIDWKVLSAVALKVEIEDINGSKWVGVLSESDWVTLNKSLSQP